MKKQATALALAVSILLSACGGAQPERLHRYTASFLTLFNTVTTIVGYAEDEETFRETAQEVYDALLEYHQLFDIYHEYEGCNNLKSVNDCAGGEPVMVDGRILELLQLYQAFSAATDGKMDATMGSVLQLWHEARQAGIDEPESAAVPEDAALREAARHVGGHLLELDMEDSTVRLTDPAARLDVGAIAKGFAVEQVCRQAPAGLLVSVGGNVRATGRKPVDGPAWVVGIQSPDATLGEYLHQVYMEDTAVVSSGDYQRYFTVDGVRYHHLIDRESLYPATLWRAVTVLHPDSAIADALSTALFLLPLEEGEKLLERWGGEAMWVAADGSEQYSRGFSAQLCQ